MNGKARITQKHRYCKMQFLSTLRAIAHMRSFISFFEMHKLPFAAILWDKIRDREQRVGVQLQITYVTNK